MAVMPEYVKFTSWRDGRRQRLKKVFIFIAFFPVIYAFA